MKVKKKSAFAKILEMIAPDGMSAEEGVLELNARIKRQTRDFTKKIKETYRKYGMNSREFADVRKEAFELMSYMTHAHDAERQIRHDVCVVPKAGSLAELELKLTVF